MNSPRQSDSLMNFKGAKVLTTVPEKRGSIKTDKAKSSRRLSVQENDQSDLKKKLKQLNRKSAIREIGELSKQEKKEINKQARN